MAVRTVSVRLQAEVSSYIAGMKNAQKATKDLATEALRSTERNHENMQKVGRAGLIAGGALAAGLGLAVKAAADFDKALSGVRAVTSGTAKEMQALRALAIDAGQATAFSASQAAEAEAELAKAGVSVSDILGGALRGSLDLAAAGQLDLADAATIAAQAMNIFKLEGSDVTHIADVLAAGANKSAADVGQLGDALRQGGLLAAQTGLGLEETVATLSAFADNALVGSDAGTSLKTMLQRLVPQGAKAQSVMDAIGFSAYDAQGNFVGLESVADQLQRGLGTLSDEQRAATLSIIFGSDAVRGANVLYELGAAGVKEYDKSVRDAGAGSRMAAVQMDNLAGDLEQLSGSIETALIQAGSGANNALRGLTQGATEAVNAFTGLPKPVQTGATAFTALASSALLTVGVVGTMVPKVREAREALRGLGAAGAAADRSLGRVGKVSAYGAAAATAAVGFSLLTKQIEKLTGNGPADIALLANALTKLTDEGHAAGEAARLFGRDLSGFNVAVRDATKPMADLGSGFGLLPSRVDTARDKLSDLDAALTSLVTRGNTEEAARQFDLLADLLPKDKVADFRGELKNYRAALADVDTQTSLAEDSTTDFAGGLDAVAPAAEDAATALDTYTAALENTVEIDAYTAVAELAKSYKDVAKELKAGGKVRNDEKIALGGFAREVRQAAQAILDQTGSQGKANKAMREGRDRFEQLAIKAGYSADEAGKLARRLLRIPTRTDVGIDTSDIDRANVKIQRLAERLRAMNGTDVAVTVGAYNRASAANLAEGGPVSGPGTGTSDSIPAWLSNGEHVWTAREVAAVGGQGAMYAMRQSALSGALRFADGGAVSARRLPPPIAGGTAGTSFDMSGWQIVAPSPTDAAEAVARKVQNETWKGGWPTP